MIYGTDGNEEDLTCVDSVWHSSTKIYRSIGVEHSDERCKVSNKSFRKEEVFHGEVANSKQKFKTEENSDFLHGLDDLCETSCSPLSNTSIEVFCTDEDAIEFIWSFLNGHSEDLIVLDFDSSKIQWKCRSINLDNTFFDIRLHSGKNSVTVEFQRRSGCCMVMSSIFRTLFDEVKLSQWHYQVKNIFTQLGDYNNNVYNNNHPNYSKSKSNFHCLSLSRPLKVIPVMGGGYPSLEEIQASITMITSWMNEIPAGNRPTDCLLQIICSFCDIYGEANNYMNTNFPGKEDVLSLMISVRSYLNKYVTVDIKKDTEIVVDDEQCVETSPNLLAIEIKKLCKYVMLSSFENL